MTQSGACQSNLRVVVHGRGAGLAGEDGLNRSIEKLANVNLDDTSYGQITKVTYKNLIYKEMNVYILVIKALTCKKHGGMKVLVWQNSDARHATPLELESFDGWNSFNVIPSSIAGHRLLLLTIVDGKVDAVATQLEPEMDHREQPSPLCCWGDQVASHLSCLHVDSVYCAYGVNGVVTVSHEAFLWGRSDKGQCGVLTQLVTCPHPVVLQISKRELDKEDGSPGDGSRVPVEKLAFSVACGESHAVALVDSTVASSRTSLVLERELPEAQPIKRDIEDELQVDDVCPLGLRLELQLPICSSLPTLVGEKDDRPSSNGGESVIEDLNVDSTQIPQRSTSIEHISSLEFRNSTGSLKSRFSFTTVDVLAAEPSHEPQRLNSLKTANIIKISCGRRHCAALTAGGEVYVWGSNEFGQVKQVSLDCVLAPVLLKVGMASSVMDVSCGDNFTALLVNNADFYPDVYFCGLHRSDRTLSVSRELHIASIRCFDDDCIAAFHVGSQLVDPNHYYEVLFRFIDFVRTTKHIHDFSQTLDEASDLNGNSGERWSAYVSDLRSIYFCLTKMAVLIRWVLFSSQSSNWITPVFSVLQESEFLDSLECLHASYCYVVAGNIFSSLTISDHVDREVTQLCEMHGIESTRHSRYLPKCCYLPCELLFKFNDVARAVVESSAFSGRDTAMWFLQKTKSLEQCFKMRLTWAKNSQSVFSDKMFLQKGLEPPNNRLVVCMFTHPAQVVTFVKDSTTIAIFYVVIFTDAFATLMKSSFRLYPFPLIWLVTLPDDKGTMVWPDGRRFEGKFSSGLVNGFADGSSYEGYMGGDFCREGHGVLFSARSVLYVGAWKADKRHGYGVADFGTKKYLGMWDNDREHGFGLVVTLDGLCFQGQFVEGRFLGRIFFPNGDVLEGTFSGPVDSEIRVRNALLTKAPFGAQRSWFDVMSDHFSSDVPQTDEKWADIFAAIFQAIGVSDCELNHNNPDAVWDSLVISCFSPSDVIDYVPAFHSPFNDKFVKMVEDYFRSACSVPYHVFSVLLHGLADVFNASYSGAGAHSLLLPAALAEIRSVLRRIYKLLRCLFPNLPAEDMCAEYNAFIPLIYPNLFTLYVIRYDNEDYWKKVKIMNLKNDVRLLESLEVDRNFWPIELEATSPLDKPLACATARSKYYAEAIDCLQRISSEFAPASKLNIIMETFAHINKCVTDVSSEGNVCLWTADSLVPVSMYVIIRAQIQHLGAELNFVKDFCPQIQVVNETQYIFVTLQGCYQHLVETVINF
ncbi:unnamed protein product [Soboliphyme baturini]|uniref:VPS9 domain-containing protein n=1 Tax=Soboliphyme baturini TaxID=241478 RepID=A0A183IE76_9BILA|nr:unnamed protein product [Soboliphyme baturini]